MAPSSHWRLVQQKRAILSHDITHGFSCIQSPHDQGHQHLKPIFLETILDSITSWGIRVGIFRIPKYVVGEKAGFGQLKTPYFYHLKYADRKSIDTAIRNWREIEYFSNLVFEKIVGTGLERANSS